MFVNLKLGFRDIWKHKFFVFACIAFIVIFNLIQTMTALTIYHLQRLGEEKVETKITSFEIIYTHYDYAYQKKDLVDIVNIYDNNAVSIKRSDSLTQLYARPVFLVFGDASIINPEISNQEGISVYAYDASLDYIEIFDVHPIHNISLAGTSTDEFGYYSLLDESVIFVVYQGDAIVELIDYMAMEGNPGRLWELISDTHIISDDNARIKKFRDFVTERVDGISFKGNFLDWSNSQKHMSNFFFSFLLPLSIVLSLTGILSFLLIFQGMLQRMKRDLTIHLQSGAMFRDVLVRFYIFYGAIIAISFVILRSFAIISLTAPIIYTFFVVVTLSISVYIARALKKTNLFENLRGDYV